MSDLDTTRHAMVGMLARFEAMQQLLLEYGSVEAFASYLASSEGEARLAAVVPRLQDGDTTVLEHDDQLASFALDALMELDVLSRLQAIEEVLDGEADEVD